MKTKAQTSRKGVRLATPATIANPTSGLRLDLPEMEVAPQPLISPADEYRAAPFVPLDDEDFFLAGFDELASGAESYRRSLPIDEISEELKAMGIDPIKLVSEQAW